MNPQTLSLLDNAASDITVEVAGFEGEWFDTQDVQGYLEEKGIFIDPSASYVEADVPLDQHQIPSSTSTMSSATASDTPDSTGGIYNFAEPEIGAPQLDDFLAGSGLASVGFSDAQTGSFFNFLRPGETIKTPGAANSQPLTWPRNHEDDFMNTSSLSLISSDAISLPRKKKVVIDVQALIDGKFVVFSTGHSQLTPKTVLAVNGICLGRSPGFRRHHVDSALTTASLEVC